MSGHSLLLPGAVEHVPLKTNSKRSMCVCLGHSGVTPLPGISSMLVRNTPRRSDKDQKLAGGRIALSSRHDSTCSSVLTDQLGSSRAQFTLVGFSSHKQHTQLRCLISPVQFGPLKPGCGALNICSNVIKKRKTLCFLISEVHIEIMIMTSCAPRPIYYERVIPSIHMFAKASSLLNSILSASHILLVCFPAFSVGSLQTSHSYSEHNR